MANENNKINELVDDDDPTSELEALTWRRDTDGHVMVATVEADASTYEVEDAREEAASVAEMRSDLAERSRKIERLQFDLEQLRSRWMGLEAEIKAREEITESLTRDLDETRGGLARKEKLLARRDQSIKSLKAEIRQRDEAYRSLENDRAEIERRLGERTVQADALEEEVGKLRDQLAGNLKGAGEGVQRRLQEQAGQLASRDMKIAELEQQIDRSERYADAVRQQLDDKTDRLEALCRDFERLEERLAESEQRIVSLGAALSTASDGKAELEDELRSIGERHEEELRLLRFELGEAQDTVTEHETFNEKLQASLTDTRSYSEQLEQMLNESEETRRSRIEELERRLEELSRENRDFEHKLATKNDTINCLIAELTNKSEQIESIGELEGVIQDIDERMTERLRERDDRDRVSRLLIGVADGKEVRFPLFKDRLTIGRTSDNDIQLKAPFISRRHAVLVSDPEAARIVDWGSKNGVYVNSNRVTEHFLVSGDVVTIGTSEFRYEERPKPDA